MKRNFKPAPFLGKKKFPAPTSKRNNFDSSIRKTSTATEANFTTNFSPYKNKATEKPRSDIKGQENVHQGMLPPRVMATKIYRISEQKNENTCNLYLRVPKENVRKEIVLNTKENECGGNGQKIRERRCIDNLLNIDHNAGDSSPYTCIFTSKNCTISDQRKMETENQAKPQTSIIMLCPFCGSEYLTSLEWRQHLNDAHEFLKRETLNLEDVNDGSVKCKECNAELNSKPFWALQQHRITHLPYSRYFKCKLCQHSFLSLVSLTQHLQKQHDYRVPHTKRFTSGVENPRLLCPFCGTAFPNIAKWQLHLNDIHAFKDKETLNMEFLDENKAKCKECDMIITNNLDALQLHRIIHLPFVLYFKCLLCEERFPTGKAHRQHFQLVHSTADGHCILFCPFCGIGFSNSLHWRKHVNEVHEFYL